MPPKVRDLVRDLEQAGFMISSGKGSHRKFVHAKVRKPVIISGSLGDDALIYQQRAVQSAIEESKK